MRKVLGIGSESGYKEYLVVNRMIKDNSEVQGVIGVLYACLDLSNLVVGRHTDEQMNVIIKQYEIWSDLLADHCDVYKTFELRVWYCTTTVNGKYFNKLSIDGFLS